MIETERLFLRPFKESDAEDVFEYLKEPLVHCFACMKLNTLDDAKAETIKRAKETDYLFNKKGARRIYAYTEDYNIPSQKLCEKLGMRREGMFIEFVSFVNDEDGNPIYENTIQYAIIKKEWQSKKERGTHEFEN